MSPVTHFLSGWVHFLFIFFNLNVMTLLCMRKSHHVVFLQEHNPTRATAPSHPSRRRDFVASLLNPGKTEPIS